MSITKINTEELLNLKKQMPVLDVRSPGEYAHAHIPGARSFPLFTNEERKIIGTSYKQESREKAIKIGLSSFGKNLVTLVESAENILAENKNASRDVIVHCWRGGMRSSAVAWLLDLYGFKVYLLQGGYKSYRKWALIQFEKKYNFRIIGGYTGSNKTGVISALKNEGENVIDLESLAGHKGSTFGNLERILQPSQEQFENNLAFELHTSSEIDPEKNIWIENESQRIGQINMPLSFFNYFSSLPSYFIDIPFEARLKHIVSGYGKSSKESLINAILRITKKLGGLEAKTAVNFLMDEDVENCFRILLKYYDKLYHKNEIKSKQDQKQIIRIECADTDAKLNLKKLLEHANAGK